MKIPAVTRHWTTLLYGPRGSCKSIDSSREMFIVLRYLEKLYLKYPSLHRAIVVTNHKLGPELEPVYLGKDVFYFDDNDIETLRYCPRKNCWRGTQPHKLHGCYLFIDDVSNFIPATEWPTLPRWFRKMMIKGRKFGIHIVATLVDPFDLVLPVRRTTDMCYKFRAMWKTRDPDETRPPLRWVFGWYLKRKITAELLWKYGDLPEQIIRLNLMEKEELHERLKEAGKAAEIVYEDTWKGDTRFFNRSGKFLWFDCGSTDAFDTLQDIADQDE